MDLSAQIQAWVDRRAAAWERLGITATIVDRPSDIDPLIARVELESSTRSAQLEIWVNGDSMLTVCDKWTQSVLLEQFELVGYDSDFDKIESTIIRSLDRDG